MQIDLNLQGNLANKTDNHTVLYKHHTWQILVQIKKWCLYNYSISNSRCETHLASLCNCELKIKLFCFFSTCTIVLIFIAVESRYLNLLVVVKFAMTQNEPK